MKFFFYPPGPAAEVSGRVSAQKRLLGVELAPPNTETDTKEKSEKETKK